MQLELINKVNNHSNPYIAFAIAFEENGTEQNSSFVELFKFLTKNAKDNINEKFFTARTSGQTIGSQYIRCYEITQKSILDVLSKVVYEKNSDWNSGTPQEIFNLLEKAGFQFNKDIKTWKIKQSDYEEFSTSINSSNELIKFLNTYSIKNEEYSSIFSISPKQEEKSICLLSNTYSQMFPEDFESQIIKYNTLHDCVKYDMNEVVDFLINSCGISPNIKNKDNDIPLFSCENLETLKHLSKYKLDWLYKNNLDKDCISIFTGLSDKNISTKMVNFSQKELNNFFANNSNINVPNDYLNERIRKSLLDMVLADRTKKDLENYIESNNVKTFSDIFDENGNSLAQICLMKNNWSRYKIFKDAYPLDHVNKDGRSSLEIILSAQRVNYEDRAKPIVDELLENGVQFKNVSFSMNLLNQYLNNSYKLTLPSWYMEAESKKRDRLIPFASSLVGEKYAKEFDDKYSLDTHYNLHGSQAEERDIKNAEAVAYLLLTHTVLYNKEAKFNISVDEIFNEDDKRYTLYNIDKNRFNNFISVINVIDRYEHLHILDYSEIWKKFEKNALEFILKTYDAYQDNISVFIHLNKSAINFLMDKKSEMFSSIVDQEFINKISIDKELSVKLDYVLLSKEMNYNEDSRIKKAIKI